MKFSTTTQHNHQSHKKKQQISWRFFCKWLPALLLPPLINFYLQASLYQFSFQWSEISPAFIHSFFLTCIPLWFIELILICLVGEPLIGAILFFLIFLVFGYANSLKIRFRSEPIYPEDLSMIFQPSLLKEMVSPLIFLSIVFLAAIVLIGVSIFLYRSRKKVTNKQWLYRIVGLIISCSFLFYLSTFNQKHNLFRKWIEQTTGELYPHQDQVFLYEQNGFVYAFLNGLKQDAMVEPSNYSKDKIESILSSYHTDDTKQIAKQSELPNIVFIMDESFSDPAQLNGIEIPDDPIHDFHEISSQTLSGNMLSPGYGGGTANIEFEALTSLSMAVFSPQITTAYTQVLSKETFVPSIVSLLNENHYQTIAIHPYNRTMYKRQQVYQKLQFDQFIYEDTMKHTDTLEQNPYISDQAAFDETLDLLKNQKDPTFIHLVTMQNHMPYANKYQEIHYPASKPSGSPDFDNYLEDIYQTSLALKNLITQLSQLDRNTLIVFWGDHLPGLYGDDIFAQNDPWVMHEPPFFIYSTKQALLPVELGAATSPVYFAPILLKAAGLPYPAFYQMLLDMYPKMPAFEKELYYYQQNWQKEKPTDFSLFEDYQLIQYDILQGKQYSLQSHFFDSSFLQK